ncbi:hypothetical protein jaqu_09660 [Jannaschia aquimarina]|uniref:Uncharacterized protein n=1 Tax=Jannaschia aquimarina TaxID=935700 RepID=A0A0D1ENJ8_9RHOB|nr:hypothetical protein jaqu_09660 [Jannaschia aquimarina]SNT18884.1 hypothetical protein SAMN05421775_10792 [Jannaschia aquimarina]
MTWKVIVSAGERPEKGLDPVRRTSRLSTGLAPRHAEQGDAKGPRRFRQGPDRAEQLDQRKPTTSSAPSVMVI